MTERKPQALEDLDARVREAQRRMSAANPPRGQGDGSSRSGLGLAFRLGVELVSALILGVAIGYLLDRWLGTKPWLLILFFILGSAAGLLNVFRVANGEARVVGFGQRGRPDKTSPPAPADDDDE